MKAAALVFAVVAAVFSGGCGMTPYAGMESREIKALSQTDDYLSGANNFLTEEEKTQ